MTAQGSLQLVLYLALLVLAAKPLGLFMTAVYEGRRTWLTPVLGRLERAHLSRRRRRRAQRERLAALCAGGAASSTSSVSPSCICCSACKACCR